MMVLMLLGLGLVCGMAAVAVIVILRLWSDESCLPDYEDILVLLETCHRN